MYIIFLDFNMRYCAAALTINVLFGICLWLMYKRIGWHRTFAWYAGLFLPIALVFTLAFNGTEFLQYFYLANSILLVLILVPYAILNLLTVPYEQAYSDYLDEKISKLTPPDDDHLYKYKERVGYNRSDWNFYDMNDTQRELALFEWRKEMRRRLFNPFECLRIFGRRHS